MLRSMSGLTSFLQAELFTLSSEAKRKHPDIKEAAERLGVILRTFKERPGYSIANELSKTEDALRPFSLACDTKQVKLVTIAIGCIQKLITFHAIPETSVRSVLRTLKEISIHGVDIQLKILQTVLPLLSNYYTVHDDVLADAMLLCFRLQDSKIAVVNNTAAATLRQLVILVFDKVAKEDKQDLDALEANHEVKLSNGETLTLHPCAKDAYYLFQDLCLLINNEPPEYIKLNQISPTFGLELVESVLTNHPSLFKSHKEFSALLRERVCPLIIKNFSDRHDYPQTMRFFRVVCILIKQFNEILVMEGEIFYSMLVKMLEPENPLWQRVLAMEIFRGVCSDAKLLCSIYKWYDRQSESTGVFRDMIIGFGRLATEKPQAVGVAQGGRESLDVGSGASSGSFYTTTISASSTGDATLPILSAASSTMRIQCMDQLDKTEPPPLPETYIFYLALLCLNSIADDLAGITLPKYSPTTGSKSNGLLPTNVITNSQLDQDDQQATESDNAEKDELGLVRDMANVAWPGLLAAMSFYLSANLEEELFQSTMKSYQNFTNVCGMLNLVTPRDAFLTNLCKCSIPLVPILTMGYFSGKNTGSTTSIVTISTQCNPPAMCYYDLPAQQQQMISNITLSDKNLYSLRILLNVTMFLGEVLGSSWYLVLETLQQADLLLFNRPSSSKGNLNLPSSQNSQPALRRTMTNSSVTSSNAASTTSGNPPLSPVEVDDLAIIRTSLNRLFDNAKYLSDSAFWWFVIALCRLSAEVSGVPFYHGEELSANKASRVKIFNNKSFAVEKLLQVATLDVGRMLQTAQDKTVWDIVMTHWIDGANYPRSPPLIRSQYCGAISDLILCAMNYTLGEQKEANESTQTKLLTALSACINYIPPCDEIQAAHETEKLSASKAYAEVQHMGLETLHNLLQTSGQSFTCGWGLIFDMLRHVIHRPVQTTTDILHEEDDMESKDEETRERTSIDTTASSATPHTSRATTGLIKVAFSSLQLICTDFISLLSPDCLRQCIATLSAFVSQNEDLNISLTAIGLLWNVSYFICTKRSDLIASEALITEDESIGKDEMNIDRVIDAKETPRTLSVLWILLLLQLSRICNDSRSEVRNGANQTLFRTIAMNGADLTPQLWEGCLWEVIFPLLDTTKLTAIRAVRQSQQAAKSESLSPLASSATPVDRTPSGFMVHHSRDTVGKQWDETKVLVLTGIANLFRDFQKQLLALPSFERAWILLLAHMENSSLQSSQEVVLASIKSFKTIITLSDGVSIDEPIVKLWRMVWSSWKRIGRGFTDRQLKEEDDTNNEPSIDPSVLSMATSLSASNQLPVSEDVTQETLTSFVGMFIDLYKVISAKFSFHDVDSFFTITRDVLCYPSSPQYRPDVDHLSPLQQSILDAVQVLDTSDPSVPPLVLREIVKYMTLAFLGPLDQPTDSKQSPSPGQRAFSTVTFIALNKRCSQFVCDMFKQFVDNATIYTQGVFEQMLAAYGLPMKLKYDCPASFKHGDDNTPLWKTATFHLTEVLRLGLDKMHRLGDELPTERCVGVWKTLVDILEGSLLSPSEPPSTLSIEQLDVDEHFDISVLSMIQSDVVIHLGEPRIPNDIISRLIDIIHESSRLYYVDGSDHHRKRNSTLEPNERATQHLAVEEKQERADRSSDIVGTTGTIVPVMKESLAYAALKALFSLCSSEKHDYLEARQRIAQTAAPILLERCETILRNFQVDEPLLGRCPFPRVRKEEILFILKEAIRLDLRPNSLTPAQHSQVTKLVFAGPKAHLFRLYPILCDLITSDDIEVVKLVRECLRRIGTELGLE